MRLPSPYLALAKLLAGVALDFLDRPQEALMLLQEAVTIWKTPRSWEASSTGSMQSGDATQDRCSAGKCYSFVKDATDAAPLETMPPNTDEHPHDTADTGEFDLMWNEDNIPAFACYEMGFILSRFPEVKTLIFPTRKLSPQEVVDGL